MPDRPLSSHLISVCIPLYNEQESIECLLNELIALLGELNNVGYEIIFVNDGSTDETPKILDSLVKDDNSFSITCIHLSRNFGQQLAISAALEAARGDICVVMDADLQDSPSVIPKMLEMINKGYEVVYAKRASREGSSLLTQAYKIHYKIISLLSDVEMPVDAGDFAMISRRVVDTINSCPERNRYLRGLRAWSGFKQIGIEVDRPQRRAGKSKYTFIKLLKLSFDGICSFSTLPLRFAVFIGAVGVFFSFLYLVYTIFALVVLKSSPPGFAAIILLLSFVSSLQLLSLGILGEYIAKIYHESKRRPLYVIDRVESNEQVTT